MHARIVMRRAALDSNARSGTPRLNDLAIRSGRPRERRRVPRKTEGTPAKKAPKGADSGLTAGKKLSYSWKVPLTTAEAVGDAPKGETRFFEN